MMIERPRLTVSQPKQTQVVCWVWKPEIASGVVVIRDEKRGLIPCLLSVLDHEEPEPEPRCFGDGMG